MTASIRTPDQRVRVFVSSTLQELSDERAVAKSAIQHLRLTPVMFELGARAHPPRDLYRAYLDQSDVFLGIYWQRYGWIAPGEAVSGLEDEYLLSGAKPRLVYVKRAESREERLGELIHRIERDDRTSYRPFSSADELEDLIENDLAQMLTERFAAAAPLPGAPLAQDEAPPPWATPLERGELFGRGPLLDEVTSLLARGDVGLVTLTGPGGTGKTRLAVHVAHAVHDTFPDGVFYVPLAGVSQARDVLSAIMATLEIASTSSGGDPEKSLIGFLCHRRALLVLDNFEQVILAAGTVARLLAACPHVKLLVTSREALRVRGEHEVHVPPLPHEPKATHTPAMALFEARAREVRPEFRIDDGNRPAVSEICRRLDALPLAIELAAARVRVLSPQAMLARLDRSLTLLSAGKRDLPERHQTLRATIEWSLGLLRSEEQLVFRRLGVFQGSFPEGAAEAVLVDAGMDALDGLTSLVEKSLLVRAEVGGEARFHMLETVRELAREHLIQAGEERAARVRHVEWLERLIVSEQKDLLTAGRRQAARDRLVPELAAARELLRFAAGPDGDVELAWRLYIRASFVLLNVAQTAETLALREIVDRIPRSSDPFRAAIADGMWSRGAAMWDDNTEPYLEASEAALVAIGDRSYLPSVLTVRATVCAHRDPARSLGYLERALALAAEEGQTYTEGWARCMVIFTHFATGKLDDAARAADEAIVVARQQGSDEGMAFALLGLAYVEVGRGDLPGARARFAEIVALARSHGAEWPRCMALAGLCSVTLAAGDETGARGLIEETIHHFIGAGFVAADSMCGALALMLARERERDRALRVFAAVHAGAEDAVGIHALFTDPSGAMRRATREVRALLGNPQPGPSEVDFASVIAAALGRSRVTA
jgi:predicted ATPase